MTVAVVGGGHGDGGGTVGEAAFLRCCCLFVTRVGSPLFLIWRCVEYVLST